MAYCDIGTGILLSQLFVIAILPTPPNTPPHQRAEIALAPLSVMAERENVVDFTVPYYDLVGITILMRKPKVNLR